MTTGAALDGLCDIVVGNIVGFNIYNLAFILGVVSLPWIIPIERSLLHRDGIVLVVSTLLGGLALLNGTVSRLEGGRLRQLVRALHRLSPPHRRRSVEH